MKLLSSLLAVSAFVPCLQDPVQEPARESLEGVAPKRTELPEEAVVMPLDTTHGFPVLEVRLGEHGPYRMILDTGSSVTVLHTRLQAELGIESRGTTRIGDPSNPTAREFDVITLPELAIGDAYFEELTAVTWTEDMGLSSVGIDGIVGLPVFHDCLLTIDYPAKQVRIEKGALPDADGVSVVEFAGEHNITLSLEVGGKTIDAHFDSGNSRAITLPARIADELTLVPGSEHSGSATRASGTVQVRGGKLDGKIRIGSRVLENPDVVFDDSLPFANVGRTFLEQGPVSIDLKNRRMRIGAASRQAGPVRAGAPGGRRLGVEMNLTGRTQLCISRVVPGSLAEKCGLLAGDVLLSVHGTPVSALDHAALKDALAGPASFPIEVQRGDERLTLRVP